MTVIDRLRDIAEELAEENREVIFPGWDYDLALSQNSDEFEKTQAIRRAAFAILNTDNADSSLKAHAKDLASLIHYIADMME